MVKMNFNFIKNNYSVQILSILTVFMILYVDFIRGYVILLAKKKLILP